MGVDIYGWVEVKEKWGWEGIINVSDLLGRNYDMFGMLFDVKNYTGFEAIAPYRGLPNDASWITKRTYKEGGPYVFGATWVTWKELKEINWDEVSQDFDGRVHIYIVKEDGSEEYVGKAWLTSALTVDEYKRIWNGEEVRKGNRIYRAERLCRKDILEEDWKILFELMEVLAKYYGDENVRLVVWFD